MKWCVRAFLGFLLVFYYNNKISTSRSSFKNTKAVSPASRICMHILLNRFCFIDIVYLCYFLTL